jgi:lipopolysaccharide/colanic/teichoic acid biosynthesis glycosyltransferase
VIVIEAPGGGRADRLDDDLTIGARLEAPVAPAELARALATHRPRAVLCKLPLDGIDAGFATACRAYGAEILVLAHPAYGMLGPVPMRRFGGMPWLRLGKRTTGPAGDVGKRLLDLALILLTTPLSLPLMFCLLLATSVGGPPLYFQERVGAGGRPFRMVKFRTMHVDAEHHTGPILAPPGDSRVTPAGRLLRRYRLDELPQLWNVLRGQMSLVGPRPERPEFVAELNSVPNYEHRHAIRPGITGIAQLTGGYNATAEDKLRCDLLYVHSRSLRSDLRLIVLTVVELFRGFPRG